MKLPTPADEERAQLRMAKDVWLEVRHKKGVTRFTDRGAIGGLRVSVKRALDQGIEWRDIEAAIRAQATDEKANPWYADQWARVAESDRREAEHVAQKMRERAEEDRQWHARQTGPRPITDILARLPGTLGDVASAHEDPLAHARQEHGA